MALYLVSVSDTADFCGSFLLEPLTLVFPVTVFEVDCRPVLLREAVLPPFFLLVAPPRSRSSIPSLRIAES